MKTKYDLSEIVGCSESSTKALNAYVRKEKKD